MFLLEHWSLVRDPKTPPGEDPRTVHLRARIFHAPNIPDGTRIITHAVVARKGDLVITFDKLAKRTGVYELGNIDPEYAAKFPDAERRARETFSKLYNFEGSRAQQKTPEVA